MMPRFKLYHALPALIILMAPPFATAQSSEPLSGLFACEALVDKDAALACFRAETAKLRGTGVTTPPINAGTQTGTAPQRPVEKAAITAPESNDDNAKKFIPLNREKTPKKRTLTIQSAQTYGGKGYMRFTLENGEVWQQTDSGKLRLGRGSGPDSLTIKKGALGSFRARVNDKAPSIRVKRVK